MTVVWHQAVTSSSSLTFADSVRWRLLQCVTGFKMKKSCKSDLSEPGGWSGPPARRRGASRCLCPLPPGLDQPHTSCYPAPLATHLVRSFNVYYLIFYVCDAICLQKKSFRNGISRCFGVKASYLTYVLFYKVLKIDMTYPGLKKQHTVRVKKLRLEKYRFRYTFYDSA